MTSLDFSSFGPLFPYPSNVTISNDKLTECTMKIGLTGYQSSGKSTLFQWLTGVEPDPSLAHVSQSAMAAVPDDRIEALCQVYRPRKITLAQLELVDTPGLSRTHEGNAARLAQIREAGCLAVVVGAYDGVTDPVAELNRFEEDLLLADFEIVAGRIERLRESVKKPRPDREKQQAELESLEPIAAALESGHAIDMAELNDQQLRSTRSFQLFTQKPRLVVLNAADDVSDSAQMAAQVPGSVPCVAVRLRLELELSQFEPAERQQFIEEMDIQSADRNGLLRMLLDASGQILFFTAGDKEVRSWLLRKDATAVEAAGDIHTDMARGFIRAETMRSEDLIRTGSEREMKAQNLVRQEPKDYVVQEGDVLLFKFNV